MKPLFQQTVLACAIVQAFTGSAFAQGADEAIPEVVITGSKPLATTTASVGGFSDTPILDTPASVTAIGLAKMQDLSIRSTTEAMKYDASVSDSYNAVGYAEQFSIRGFKLDNNASYRKDGIAIPADTQIPLENKERIEILKGLAGLQAGVATPGGIVNYVTKRPTDKPLRSATVEASQRGNLYGAVDFGGRFDDTRFGYRINAAVEDIHPYVRGANGERQFVSGAFDWQITPDALLQLDVDYQHKSQLTAPGFQLFDGVSLPAGVSPKMFLNDQPWARPVDTRSTNAGLRFEYKLAPDWIASVNANKHWFRRDDYTAFPYGCTAANGDYFNGYCANGDYDVYDYQSAGERKTPWGLQAKLEGKFATGAMRHALTLGGAYSERHDSWGDYVYDWVGTSNIWHNRIVPPTDPTHVTGPVSERRTDKESALFAQDIVTLTAQATLHAGVRYVKLERDQFVAADTPNAKTDDAFLLPNVALVYRLVPDWNVYGAYSQGMENGGIAPFRTSNENQALPPSRSRQVELGVKGTLGTAMTVTAALFQIRKGLEFTDQNQVVVVNGEPRPPFVRSGDETHRGLELSAEGKATADLAYGLSLLALNTKQEGTGDATLDGKRVTNVPNVKSSAWLDYAVPALPGLKLSGDWQYAGRKAFDAGNSVMVPSYNVFGLGASYALKLASTRVTLRARVDNVLDTFYWRDVTPELGGYLFAGAPRTFRVSAQFDF
jgi:iron complex outermembrane receptor protein